MGCRALASEPGSRGGGRAGAPGPRGSPPGPEELRGHLFTDPQVLEGQSRSKRDAHMWRVERGVGKSCREPEAGVQPPRGVLVHSTSQELALSLWRWQDCGASTQGRNGEASQADHGAMRQTSPRPRSAGARPLPGSSANGQPQSTRPGCAPVASNTAWPSSRARTLSSNCFSCSSSPETRACTFP